MNLKLKDYIAIAVVTVATFPILYLVMLFATGSARIVFDKPDDEKPKTEKVQLVKQSARRDSLAAVNSRTYQALKKERGELEKERQRLREQQDRIDLLQTEVENERRKIREERKMMEKIVSASDSLGKKKIRDVAKMYGAMRPSEAAAILGTMDEKLVARILKAINDDRQKAKILSSFSRAKAARISKIIGAP